jgi:hypothetical protein
MMGEAAIRFKVNRNRGNVLDLQKKPPDFRACHAIAGIDCNGEGVPGTDTSGNHIDIRISQVTFFV